MEDMIQRLIAERNAVINKQRAMLDVAQAADRDLTSQESDRFDAQQVDVDALDSRVAELGEVMRRNRDADRQRAPYADALNNGGVARGLYNEFTGADMNPTDLELREWMRGDGSQRDIAVSLSQVQTRDLATGTAGAGGATVPTDFARRLHEHMVESAAIRQTNATVLRTESGENISVPKTTAHGSAALVAEGGTITESDPTPQ